MASAESGEIREHIVKDTLRENVTVEQQRREWEAYARTLPLAKGMTLQDDVLGKVPCVWVREATQSSHQVILYIHGGGMVEGSAMTHREFASRLVAVTRIPVLLVEYRLAPEHPYPAGLQDIQAVYHAILERGFQPRNLFLGGDSSGGGLALAALLKLRDRGAPLPAKAFCLSGAFDGTLSGESMGTRATCDPFTSPEVLAHCYRLYAQGESLRDPYISPLYADVSGLPPILLQVGDHEILLSDSTRLAEKITQCGGEAVLRVWDSMWHIWPLYADFPEAREAIEEIRDFLAPTNQ